MINEAFVELEPSVATKAACRAVGRCRATHYRRCASPRLGPRRPRRRPPNALSEAERDAVLEVRHGRFVDDAPAPAWATTLDEGVYLASESTMYRLFATADRPGIDADRPPTRRAPSPSSSPRSRTRCGPTTSPSSKVPAAVCTTTCS